MAPSASPPLGGRPLAGGYANGLSFVKETRKTPLRVLGSSYAGQKSPTRPISGRYLGSVVLYSFLGGALPLPSKMTLRTQAPESRLCSTRAAATA